MPHTGSVRGYRDPPNGILSSCKILSVGLPVRGYWGSGSMGPLVRAAPGARDLPHVPPACVNGRAQIHCFLCFCPFFELPPPPRHFSRGCGCLVSFAPQTLLQAFIHHSSGNFQSPPRKPLTSREVIRSSLSDRRCHMRPLEVSVFSRGCFRHQVLVQFIERLQKKK